MAETSRRAIEPPPSVDYVLHQAALPSVPKSVELPIESNRDQYPRNRQHAGGRARCRSVKRFVFAASSSAYGDTPTLAQAAKRYDNQPEESLRHPESGRRDVLQDVSTSIYGLETVALRYFNIFGPRQDPTSFYSAVIPKFIAACLRNDEAPTIFGDGETSRDFTYIANVVAGEPQGVYRFDKAAVRAK